MAEQDELLRAVLREERRTRELIAEAVAAGSELEQVLNVARDSSKGELFAFRLRGEPTMRALGPLFREMQRAIDKLSRKKSVWEIDVLAVLHGSDVVISQHRPRMPPDSLYDGTPAQLSPGSDLWATINGATERANLEARKRVVGLIDAVGANAELYWSAAGDEHWEDLELHDDQVDALRERLLRRERVPVPPPQTFTRRGRFDLHDDTVGMVGLLPKGRARRIRLRADPSKTRGLRSGFWHTFTYLEEKRLDELGRLRTTRTLLSIDEDDQLPLRGSSLENIHDVPYDTPGDRDQDEAPAPARPKRPAEDE